MKCNICKQDVDLVLALDSEYSVSSLGKALNAQAKIYSCSHCSHCQTAPSIDLFEYYAKEYKTLSVSFEEDDLYAYESGSPVYRNEHMAKTMIEKLRGIEFTDGPILDFGCGKSLAMRHLMNMTSRKDIYLYDVSEDYVKFWDSFIPESQYSCFELPAEWQGYFSVVTSFFSLEHVPDPLDELNKINRLLGKSGLIYLIVPNMYSANVADMLVIDHIQHYSEASMKLLLSLSGFELVEADHVSHTQGSIYIARAGKIAGTTEPDKTEVNKSVEDCRNISDFWQAVNESVQGFEAEMEKKGVDRYYIIGAGFLGTYISLQLKHSSRLAGFIDSNQHKQSKGWQGKKVYAPGSVAADDSTAFLSGFNKDQVRTVLTGLLPPGVATERIWTLNRVPVVLHQAR